MDNTAILAPDDTQPHNTVVEMNTSSSDTRAQPTTHNMCAGDSRQDTITPLTHLPQEQQLQTTFTEGQEQTGDKPANQTGDCVISEEKTCNEAALSADCHGVEIDGEDTNCSRTKGNSSGASSDSSPNNNQSSGKVTYGAQPVYITAGQPVIYTSDGQPMYQSGGQQQVIYTQHTQPVYVSPTQQQQTYVVVETTPVVVTFVNPLEDEKNRRMFIRRMYMVLCLDLLVLFGSVTLATVLPDAQDRIDKHHGAFVGFGVCFMIISTCMLCCCFDFLKTSPGCWIYNFVDVASFTCFAVVIVGRYHTRTVALSAGVTLACFLVLTAVAFCSKTDFTEWYGVACVVFLVLMLFAIVLPFFMTRAEFKWIEFAISIGFAMLFCVYIVMDTQMMCKKNVHQIYPEMYVLGATLIFSDIVLLFFTLLGIFGKSE